MKVYYIVFLNTYNLYDKSPNALIINVVVSIWHGQVSNLSIKIYKTIIVFLNEILIIRYYITLLCTIPQLIS